MIHVEGLTKYYDDFCAVDHIDLDIKGGEIVGLLGPNGAGKTTTLRMLTGYFQPSMGDIRVKEFSIHQDSLAIKRLIGYLPESAPLYKGMIVYDYLNHVASIRGLENGAKQRRLAELADMCGLREIMHKTIETLSKGLKQRVGLAHAMMSDPEILVLDEPTSGLDPNQIVEIREIIRRIGEHKTVILSTHILSEAEATCDRIIIINRGKIVADGSTQDLTAQQGREKQIQIGLLSASAEAVTAQIGAVPGIMRVEPMASQEDNLLRVNVICDAQTDARADLYAAIKATDWILVEMSRETQTLETIFRELTREN
ncbi:MAG: ATP-binding cassette domain-containing protein [Desulfatitalea sp.]|nr:ABC transporter ATP-binding protein [Desulfatitalea sp.]NNK00790.1 ATP-binding cassette domain-containing protein [Desulfatitalea sp.]